MKLKFIVILMLSFIYGCSSSYFLSDEYVRKFSSLSPGNNHTLYFKKKAELTSRGNLLITTHELVKLSGEMTDQAQYFSLYLSSMDELDYFYARVIKKDGSSIEYGKSELSEHNISSSRQITESAIYQLELKEKSRDDQFLEVIYCQHQGFPNLGFIFNLAEAGVEADTVKCEIAVPDAGNLHYLTVNSTVKPELRSEDNKKTYLFTWSDYKRNPLVSVFEKRNNGPALIASFTDGGTNSGKDDPWISFGNWYQKLIADKVKSNEEIKALAAEITRGITDPKEKLDAIFNYCQKNIRYEQVSIKGGEIIPNDCSLILQRKFGDCKDYSAIIYSLAQSLGINTELALCFRGRGREFISNIAVSQFNHMIVHFSDKGKDYWYDGTNRISRPGITTFDLANQMALVLEKDNSRIVQIKENEANLFTLKGTLKESGDIFSGDLTLTFSEQYAIDFFYPSIFLNRADMRDMLTEWLSENLSRNLSVTDIKWQEEKGNFVVYLRGKFPNSFTRISQAKYTSISKIFPDLFFVNSSEKTEKLFYFPKFSRVNIEVSFPEMSDAEQTGEQKEACFRYSYSLPIGPFTDESLRNDFYARFNKVYTELNKKLKLIPKIQK
ncbi:MAG: transglutaminase-like domain-containing protein [Bacillota bacterium]